MTDSSFKIKSYSEIAEGIAKLIESESDPAPQAPLEALVTFIANNKDVVKTIIAAIEEEENA